MFLQVSVKGGTPLASGPTSFPGGGGTSGLWSQVLFWGGTPWPLVPGPFWRKGVPHTRTGGTPSKDRGTPPPRPAKTGSAATPRAVSLLRSGGFSSFN